MKKEEVYGHIDHTLLKAFSTTEQIEAITEEALKYGTASICIPASFVNYIHNKYKDVNICTVIGFPLGYSTTPIKVAEAKQAIEDGANEIDMVINIGWAKEHKITVALVFGIISFILFKYTMFGKHCRAIGSRMEVCRQSGVRVKLVQYGSYVFTGLASGLVAFFFLIRSGAANIGTASNLEFNALQALMLGGVLITGGSSVKFRSAVIGSITMAALANGMTLWGVETLTQQLIKGFIFLIVIALTFERKSVEVIK